MRFDIDRGQAERLCRAALEEPDRHAALAFLGQALPSLDTEVPGLRNEGLFALHALTADAPRRPEWGAAEQNARRVAARRGGELLAGLGFKVERLDNLTLLLRGGERRAALAVLLDPGEIPEAGTARFNSLSPVSYALRKADGENLPWVMVLQGDRLRLYPTAVGTGVGRRGRTETYVEVQGSILSDQHLGYLWMLFSAEALQPPPGVFIGNQAPYLLWPRGDASDRAFMLGALSSIPLDWYARRFVELNANFFIFNPIPVPRPPRDDPRRRRAVALAGRLACPGQRFVDSATAVGVAWGHCRKTRSRT